MNCNTTWKGLHDDVNALADCLHSYSKCLNAQNEQTKKYHSQVYQARSVGKNATVVYRCKASCVESKFKHINEAMSTAKLSEPVLFDEKLHLKKAV